STAQMCTMPESSSRGMLHPPRWTAPGTAHQSPCEGDAVMSINPPPNAKERSKALDLALQQIEKQFGKGAIMKLGEGNAVPETEVISTGSIALDLALGVAGLPRGRVIQIYGPQS